MPGRMFGEVDSTDRLPKLRAASFTPHRQVVGLTDAGRVPSGDLRWEPSPERPLDLGGPSDREYCPMGPEFSNVPAFGHFASIARRFPDKVAIEGREFAMTYGQLLDRAQNLAGHLLRHVPQGRPVGLLLGNSPWFPLAMLSCMASGRPFLPLNPRDPDDRIAEIAADASLPALIGCGPSPFVGAAAGMRRRWIDVSRWVAQNGGDAPPAALPKVDVDAPAVILYTSGSTGHPKGIVNSQRSILARVQQYVDAGHFGPDDVFMPLSGAATIAGCREITSALLCGAKLHAVDVEEAGLRGLRRRIEAHQVTVIYLVPTLLRALITAPGDASLASLRSVRLAGEKVLWSDIALARQVLAPTCLIQVAYSSTETTGAQWFLPQGAVEDGACVSAGYLMPDIEYAIVDEDGVPVAPGETGELLIRSRYVRLGQWAYGQFVEAQPDRDDPRRRVFATGDLVRIDEEGRLHIAGRKGRQLKINGRRVEPAELEVVLRGAPNVREAVAIVSRGTELVAVVVPADGVADTLSDELRARIRRALPPALHPTRLHLIGEIPRLAGGKVDYAGLQDMDAAALNMREASSWSRDLAPDESSAVLADADGPEKQIVAEVWTNLLKRSPDGPWDEAGGDSLKLLRFVMELEDRVGHELPLEAFTIGMTADDMVIAVTSGSGARRAAPDPAKPILFLLPGSVGYGPSLASFGAALESVSQVVPVRYPDLDATLSGRGTVADMSAYVLKQIRAVLPAGDVRLLGYSLGGAVAFEVAKELLAEGRGVRFFGILDTNLGNSNVRRGALRETIARTAQRIRAHRVTAFRMLCRAVAKIAARIGGQRALAKLTESRIMQRLPTAKFILRLELEEILRMQEMRRWVALSKPQLPIKGTLFRCARVGLPAELGWGGLLAALDVVAVAGGHLDLVVEPHLARNRPLIEAALREGGCDNEQPRPVPAAKPRGAPDENWQEAGLEHA